MSTNIRARNPFKFSDENEIPEGVVLDEQEQEEIITRLHQESDTANQLYIYAVDAILLLSLLLQIIYLVNPSKDSPILMIFPDEPDSPIPFTGLQTLLSILLTLNAFLLNHQRPSSPITQSRPRAHSSQKAPASIPIIQHRAEYLSISLSKVKPFASFTVSFILAALSPTISLLSGRRWQMTVWWCFTGLNLLLVQFIVRSIENEKRSIEQLEAKKYTAAGA